MQPTPAQKDSMLINTNLLNQTHRIARSLRRRASQKATTLGVVAVVTLATQPSFGWQFRDVTPDQPKAAETLPIEKLEAAPKAIVESAPPRELKLPPKKIVKVGEVIDTVEEVPVEPVLSDPTVADEAPSALILTPDNAGPPAAIAATEVEVISPEVPVVVESSVIETPVNINPVDVNPIDAETRAALAAESRLSRKKIVENVDPKDPYWTGKALADQVAPQVQDEDPDSIRPMHFNNVLVGKTSLKEVVRRWGQPYKIVRGKNRDIIKYKTEIFRQVDLTIVNDTVQEMLIHLHEPLDPAHTASELSISELRPVPVPDEKGRVMGLAYPERGVLFSFRPNDPDTLVSKIHLEPINPEPFVLRALYDFNREFEVDLQDIELALEMNPTYAKAFWARAEILEKVGRYQAALSAAEDATHFDGTNPLYKLTHARILAANGEADRAEKIADAILETAQAHPTHRAMASLLKGNLIADGSTPRYKEAMKHHLRAIDLAAPLANDPAFADRRLAKHILVDAHLGVARNISQGKYQRQRTGVPKWLSRSRALVEELITRDQGDPALRLKVYKHVLASAADLENPDDPSRVLEDLIAEGRRQIEDTPDSMAKTRLEWDLGSALAEGVRLERLRGADRSALAIADDALVLLQQSAAERQATPEQRYTVGRLYFQIGSLYAVHRGDHAEAIEWYAKATPLLSQDVPVGVQAHPKIHGETFISMGVSYWKQGQKDRAIELTEQGAEVLQHAVVEGLLQPETLSISYGNLASMHKQIGNGSDARAFAELANSLEAGGSTVTR